MNKILACSLAAIALPFFVVAENLAFVGGTDSNAMLYSCGQPIRFNLRLVDRDAGCAPVAGRTLVWERTGDDGITEKGEADSTSPLSIVTKIDKPGFVHLVVRVRKAGDSAKWERTADGKRDVSWDGSAGADVNKIEAWPIPADFNAFWDARVDEISKAPCNVQLTPLESKEKDVAYVKFSIPMPDGTHAATGVAAWPTNVPPRSLPLRICVTGYGFGRTGIHLPSVKRDGGRIELSVTRQGEEPREDDAYYSNLQTNICKNFCFRNNRGKPEQTDYCKMLLRGLMAMRWAKTLPLWNGKDMVTTGGSMGGYQAIGLAALDRQVTMVDATIPWCADFAGYSKFKRLGGWQPGWSQTLDYMALSHLATRVTCPVRMLIGLGDYVCPPSGEVLLFNNLKGSKRLVVQQNMVHGSRLGPHAPCYVFDGRIAPTGGDFYVDANSGDDFNDGTDASRAWKTLSRANSAPLEPGSRILFRRGGVYRGQLELLSGSKKRPNVYTAYGEGEKPVMQCSVDLCEMPWVWKKEDGGLWSYHLESAEYDVGNLIFNHGAEGCGVKCNRRPEIAKEGDFWWDMKNRRLWLKSEKKPSARWQSIEAAIKRHGVRHDNVHDVIVDGVAVRYSAAHGFGGAGAKRYTIRNCDISWIGGGFHYVNDKGDGVRFGNGIEFWGAVEDATIEDNRIWECWDAGLTSQSSEKDTVQRNVVWRGNEVWNCEYSFEFWQQGEGASTENILVEKNVFRDAGKGWGHKVRWNPNAAHLMMYDTTAPSKNFMIRNNTFAASENCIMRLFNDWGGALKMKGNLWISAGAPLCRYHGRPQKDLTYLYPDRLDKINDDNRAEIESQGSGATVFEATEDDFKRMNSQFGFKKQTFKKGETK